MEKRPVLALNWGCQKRYWYWVCQASSLISWLRRRRRRIYHIVKLVLCIQPILREQWEQISASALLKGWRINLMYMFWWWRGKPDYLEDTLHTERPQWDGKLGPSRCWPLRHCAILRSRYFLHTHTSHISTVSIQFLLLLSSSSSSYPTSLRGEMFTTSELIQIYHHHHLHKCFCLRQPSFFLIKASWYDGNTTIVCGKDKQDFYFWKPRWLKETDITL